MGLSTDLNFLYVMVSDRMFVYGLNGSKYKTRQTAQNWRSDRTPMANFNGSSLVIGGQVYSMPDYDYQLLQNLNSTNYAAVGKDGLVYVGYYESFSMDIWRRDHCSDSFVLSQSINTTDIPYKVVVDGGGTAFAVATQRQVYIYRNLSGSFRMVDMFPNVFLDTSYVQLLGNGDLSLLVANYYSTFNVFRVVDGEYSNVQTLKYNETMWDASLYNDTLVIVFKNITRVLRLTTNGTFSPLQNITQNFLKATIKNGTLVCVDPYSAFVYRYSDKATPSANSSGHSGHNSQSLCDDRLHIRSAKQ